MPFLIRYSTNTGHSTFAVEQLSPNPTEVDYPPTREYNARITQDHAVVIQRPIKDSRTRRWIWRNYRSNIATYETQWTNLKSMEARARALSDPEPVAPFTTYADSLTKNPLIQIWENITDEGGFGETTDDLAPDLVSYTNIQWTQVKFLQVHRTTRKGTGYVVYDESFIEFVIADPAWESF